MSKLLWLSYSSHSAGANDGDDTEGGTDDSDGVDSDDGDDDNMAANNLFLFDRNFTEDRISFNPHNIF